MTSLNSLQNKLIHNLENNIYAKLVVFDSNRVGFKAIKDIPPNTNPFVFTNNDKPFYDFVELSDIDIAMANLDPNVIDLINLLFNSETQSYFIPYFGLNTMNIIMYIKRDLANHNLTYKTDDLVNINDVELYEFITTRQINMGEELVVPGLKFNISKIRGNYSESKIATRKRLVIESLKNVCCKIGPMTIPNVSGTGVIVIKNIDAGINPFMTTNNACYLYNGVNIPKSVIDALSNREVKKIVRDFISPDDKFMYCIPYFGFNSLNITFYLNHSKNPNLDVVSDSCEYLGFITNKNLAPNQELFINYSNYNENFEEIMKFTPLKI
jgi:hypothetical protein